MSAARKSDPLAALLNHGRRLHLQHGPIDLIIEAHGAPEEIQKSYLHAKIAFEPILTELVGELDLLRRPIAQNNPDPIGPIARRMNSAVVPYASKCVTPMAAVAGAVADHMLQQLISDRKLSRAYVNNGGDISLYLARDAIFNIGVCDDPITGQQAAKIKINCNDNIGGLATSGWQGRSHSLGIADAVTVLACTAAEADVAATMIANAVNLSNCSAVERLPACELAPDSDLGSRLVTVAVGELSISEISAALDTGVKQATSYYDRDLFHAAYINLKGNVRIVGDHFGRNNLIGMNQIDKTTGRLAMHV